MHNACLLEFFERLTRLNQVANTSDETEMWKQVRAFDEILAPFGYQLVSFADQTCFVPVQHTLLKRDV